MAVAGRREPRALGSRAYHVACLAVSSFGTKIGEHNGPWVAVHGFVKAGDRVLGREAWAFISALVTPKKSAPQLVAALKAGTRPWVARDVPATTTHSLARSPGTRASPPKCLPNRRGARISRKRSRRRAQHGGRDTRARLRVGELPQRDEPSRKRAGAVAATSLRDSTCGAHHKLRPVPADGTRATITLSGVDGSEGRRPVHSRGPASAVHRRPRCRLVCVRRARLAALSTITTAMARGCSAATSERVGEVLTEADLKQRPKPPSKKKTGKRQPARTSTPKRPPDKKGSRSRLPQRCETGQEEVVTSLPGSGQWSRPLTTGCSRRSAARPAAKPGRSASVKR